MAKVCMISSLHGLYDDRVYWKEAVSLKNHGFDLTHVTFGTEELDTVSEHGIRLIQVKKRQYFRNPYLDIAYRKLTFRYNPYKALLKVCAGLQADVYHFHDIQVNRIGAGLKALPHHPRVIYDVHEDYADLLLSHFPRRGIIRWAIRLYGAWLNRWEANHASVYDYIVAAVEHIRRKFSTPVFAGKTAVIYNYTTLKDSETESAGPKRFDAIYSGQINAMRGIMQILKAVMIVRQTLPSIRVALVGPVPDRSFHAAILRFLDEHGLDDHVELTGQVPYGEMGQYYRNSRIGLGLFLPVSIFQYGIQIKTFEYMTFGLPLVCSNSGTISQIVSENQCGIPVDPLSADAISEAVVRLLSDRDLYDRFSHNARIAVKTKYSWHSEEKKLIAIYNRLCRVERSP